MRFMVLRNSVYVLILQRLGRHIPPTGSHQQALATMTKIVSRVMLALAEPSRSLGT
jgi:hypothetical protein